LVFKNGRQDDAGGRKRETKEDLEKAARFPMGAAGQSSTFDVSLLSWPLRVQQSWHLGGSRPEQGDTHMGGDKPHGGVGARLEYKKEKTKPLTLA
jgi:hypothetical protein